MGTEVGFDALGCVALVGHYNVVPVVRKTQSAWCCSPPAPQHTCALLYTHIPINPPTHAPECQSGDFVVHRTSDIVPEKYIDDIQGDPAVAGLAPQKTPRQVFPHHTEPFPSCPPTGRRDAHGLQFLAQQSCGFHAIANGRVFSTHLFKRQPGVERLLERLLEFKGVHTAGSICVEIHESHIHDDLCPFRYVLHQAGRTMDCGGLNRRNMFGVRRVVLLRQESQKFLHRTHELITHVMRGPGRADFWALVSNEPLMSCVLDTLRNRDQFHLLMGVQRSKHRNTSFIYLVYTFSYIQRRKLAL